MAKKENHCFTCGRKLLSYSWRLGYDSAGKPILIDSEYCLKNKGWRILLPGYHPERPDSYQRMMLDLKK